METIGIDRATEKASKRINLFIVGLMILPIYIKFMDVMSNIISFDTVITSYIYYGWLWILLVLALPGLIKKNSNEIIITAAVVAGIIIFSLILFPSSGKYIFDNDIEKIATFNTPVFLLSASFLIVGLAVVNIEQLISMICKGAKLGILIATCSYVIVLAKGMNIHYDDMANAYAIGLLVCLLIPFSERKNLIYIILGMVCLMITGTRGPILCVVVAFIFKGVIFEVKYTKKFVNTVLYIVIGLLIYYMLGVRIIEGFSDLMSNFDVSNLRIVDYFRDEMLLDSSGRDDYYNELIQAIKEQPIAGYGIGGDRYILGDSYAHNIIIECLVSFGGFGGGAIVVWIMANSLRLLRSKHLDLRKLGIGLFCGIIIKLMISSSVIMSKEFFLFMGICMSSKKYLAEKNAEEVKTDN